jgi:GntR family transcriptional regulator, vanillate catabolism transcriptional regulator
MSGQSQTTRALLTLRELLLNGEFEPGEPLSELPLVERVGVSRTPLRLALARLEHEGLVEERSGGGYSVRAFTRRDIGDAIELRGVLEGTAARLAAERGVGRRLIGRMRAGQEHMEAVLRDGDGSLDSFMEYVALNEMFHSRLVECADSPVLERAIERVVSLPFASPGAFVLAESELDRSREILLVALSQHRALLAAIENRQGARAEAVAREHARIAAENLDVVLHDREARERVPGGNLVRLPLPGA